MAITTHRTARVPRVKKGIGGILPWWGTVNNMHKIYAVALDLENFTASVSAGFDSLNQLFRASGMWLCRTGWYLIYF